MNSNRTAASARANSPGALARLKKNIVRDRYLLLIALPVVVYYIVFQYTPMYGITIAFKNFRPLEGIIGSEWIGLKYFYQFFNSVYFWRTIRNTFLISLYSLIFGFPVPILFAMLLNELKDTLFKKTVQTASYLPHFISLVVVVGIIYNFTSPLDGIVNHALVFFGSDPVNFLIRPEWFRAIYVLSDIWQYFGWESIIFLAALSGINPQLYEAANIDGATRWQNAWRITFPSLLPTIIILFILKMGNLMDVGFEKVLLLYSPAIYETADIIGTFVYRRGIQNAEFSYGAAVSLFNNVINIAMLYVANRISRKVSETSLW